MATDFFSKKKQPPPFKVKQLFPNACNCCSIIDRDINYTPYTYRLINTKLEPKYISKFSNTFVVLKEKYKISN